MALKSHKPYICPRSNAVEYVFFRLGRHKSLHRRAITYIVPIAVKREYMYETKAGYTSWCQSTLFKKKKYLLWDAVAPKLKIV